MRKNNIKNSKIKTIKIDPSNPKYTTKNIKNKDKNSEFKAKKYYDYDDIEYEGIGDTKNLYNDIDDGYCKPIKAYEAFDNSYVKYHSEGDKDKTLSIKEYFNMIRQYLSDIINDHKDEWKIQLSVRINFVLSADSKDSKDSKHSEDSNESRIMYKNSDNVVIMIGCEIDEILKNVLNLF